MKKIVDKVNQGPWTQFWDMHSGGGQKEKWSLIFIQAPEDEAEVIFYNRFGHNPHRVTCTCCGSDYSVSEFKTLMDATGYHRGCKSNDNRKKNQPLYLEEHTGKSYDKFIPFTEFLKERKVRDGEVLLIFKVEIKPEERKGEVPEQGYVWQD